MLMNQADIDKARQILSAAQEMRGVQDVTNYSVHERIVEMVARKIADIRSSSRVKESGAEGAQSADRDPPPMVPSAEERSRRILSNALVPDGDVQPYSVRREQKYEITKAYRDGWNAALPRIEALEAEVALLFAGNERLRDGFADISKALLASAEHDKTVYLQGITDERERVARLRAPATEDAREAARWLWEQLHGYDPIEAITERWVGVHPRLKAEFEYMEAALAAAHAQGRWEGIEAAAQISDRYAETPPSIEGNNTLEAFEEGMNHQAGCVDAAYLIAAAIRALAAPEPQETPHG